MRLNEAANPIGGANHERRQEGGDRGDADRQRIEVVMGGAASEADTGNDEGEFADLRHR